MLELFWLENHFIMILFRILENINFTKVKDLEESCFLTMKENGWFMTLSHIFMFKEIQVFPNIKHLLYLTKLELEEQT
jgi:hypothetical protein